MRRICSALLARPAFICAAIALATAANAQTQTLGDALDAPSLIWTTGGDLPWVIETDTTHDGQAAVSSSTLGLGQANWLQTTVTGPTAVTFWCKTSTYRGYGLLNFFVGGNPQLSVSGEVDWQEHNLYVPPGVQTLKWTFALNGTSSAAQNMAWLDQVAFSGPAAPAIVAQPTNQTVLAGNPISVAVAVSGTEPFSYQWRQNGQSLAGATMISWSSADAQAANAGDYSVVVTNLFGAATSQVATVTLLPSSPVFISQPASQGAPPGSTATFSAAVKGSEPVGWEWYSNGAALAGATSNKISIPNVTAAAWASYWVVATNAYGSTTSSVVTLSYSPVLAWGSTPYGVPGGVLPSATNIVALTGGDRHILALRGDGAIVAWGDDSLGQTDVPADATNIVAIAAGSDHSLGVRADGTVALWGKIIMSFIDSVPTELTNAVTVALGPGAQHALALRADGTVDDWGGTGPALTNIPLGATNLVGVAAGAYHSLALQADGTVIAWGDNSRGQCAVPSRATNVVAVAAGWFHNLALLADRTLLQWGSGYSSPGSVPAAATNIVAFGCGGNHSLALRADGKLLAWGDSSDGQTTIPPWATNLVAVAGTSFGSLALSGNGPPVVTALLPDRAVLPGGTVYFRSTAVGALPVYYQWRFNGTNLPGATNATLIISNAQPSQAGAYSVLVSNAVGTAASPSAVLTVVLQPSVILPASLSTSNGRLGFLANGPAGFVWSLEASTNLTSWSELATVTNTTGTMTLTDPAPNFTRRFYRLRLLR